MVGQNNSGSPSLNSDNNNETFGVLIVTFLLSFPNQNIMLETILFSDLFCFVNPLHILNTDGFPLYCLVLLLLHLTTLDRASNKPAFARFNLHINHIFTKSVIRATYLLVPHLSFLMLSYLICTDSLAVVAALNNKLSSFLLTDILFPLFRSV